MKKLLVVDDNISVLKQINALLEDRYEFFLAKAGAMALKMCPQIKPDAILLDIEMPEMDGFAVIAQLKADPGLSSIPVVFLSALTRQPGNGSLNPARWIYWPNRLTGIA